MPKPDEKPRPSAPGADSAAGSGGPVPPEPAGPDQGATGRYLVLLCQDKAAEAVKTLSEMAGVEIVGAAAGSADAALRGKLPAECAIVFERIGVALVRCSGDKQQLLHMAAVGGNESILAVEPERRVYAIAGKRDVGIPAPVAPGDASLATYLAGYRDAVNDLVERALARDGKAGAAGQAAATDETSSTWGIQATRSAVSSYTGKGIRLAVLDTGLDLEHPDFAGRGIVSRSFVEGQAVQDGNGHGTHCAGIAGGPAAPGRPPRYGVAGEAELYIGKVLGDEGGGADGGVLDGINWAVENQCQIVSMSLGSALQDGQGYSRIFEEVARRALAAGTVIIAAAGNDSRRPEFIAPVSHPANCPSILAVAAVDQDLQIAPFSSGGLVEDGGQVDVAAPGVAVTSSWPAPQMYNTISGTSMATPFVSGIAALHAQADPAARGRVLLNLILQNTRRLALPSRDVGAGLIQAP
ncbi:S8 family serine peptidase [Pollutimonas bauzanensis]|uniref:Subtilase family protein n=1 Tax=Pollutimonas bauzanensis TaxID=658167 RepID=A0A1M5YQZ5_9BURK|nr:S8 family serine peptidase [Pollutimonas bauzanensis]SHI14299.1 Subtilase family protein [Pollutimonas bauzanensis]